MSAYAALPALPAVFADPIYSLPSALLAWRCYFMLGGGYKRVFRYRCCCAPAYMFEAICRLLLSGAGVYRAVS